MPDLGAVLVKRYGLPWAEVKKMHVLLTEGMPSNPPTAAARLVTTAILVDRPIKVGVYAIGTAIKGPEDANDRSIGRAIAIARAVQHSAWRFSGHEID